jgi:hypothetical protein
MNESSGNWLGMIEDRLDDHCTGLKLLQNVGPVREAAVQDSNKGCGAGVLTLKSGLELGCVFIEGVLSTWIKVGRGCRVR